MNSREQILKMISENKPAASAMPQIDIISKMETSYTASFMKALEKVGATVVQVPTMEDLVTIFHKSGGGVEDILNTIPEIGEINLGDLRDRKAVALAGVYQTWVRGTLGVAENGAIWLEESSMVNRLLPFICEHLIIVLDASQIVADMHQAYSKIQIDKEGYGVFLAGPSKTADIEQSLVIGAHGARSLVVYLIDKDFKQHETTAVCGPGCVC
jgi:L-lactate dehydrogenase complex protein LldG